MLLGLFIILKVETLYYYEKETEGFNWHTII